MCSLSLLQRVETDNPRKKREIFSKDEKPSLLQHEVGFPNLSGKRKLGELHRLPPLAEKPSICAPTLTSSSPPHYSYQQHPHFVFPRDCGERGMLWKGGGKGRGEEGREMTSAKTFRGASSFSPSTLPKQFRAPVDEKPVPSAFFAYLV